MTPDYHQLFLRLANKNFRQGAYFRTQARILREAADKEQDEYEKALIEGESTALDTVASSMEFIVGKAVYGIPEADKDQIQTLKAI